MKEKLKTKDCSKEFFIKRNESLTMKVINI